MIESDSEIESQKSGTVSLADVSQCCLVFLAREPQDPNFGHPWLNSSLDRLITQILSSDNFKTDILEPVLLREGLPHLSVAAVPPWSLLDWVQQRLPLQDATRRAVGLVRTWELLLELLLADRNLALLAPDLTAAGIDALLAERVRSEPALTMTRAIVGAVDAASVFQIRGWAIDFCDKSTRVQLEFFADNIFLGTAMCDEPRPDVRDHVGGDGNCGFSFAVPSAHRLTFASGRAIRAIDPISGQAVGNSMLVHADTAQGWDTIEATRREVIALRKTLERIERTLPDLSRLASVPIEAYGAYWERFYRLSPDFRGELRSEGERFTYRPLISIVVPTWNSDIRLLERAINSVLDQTYESWELIIADDGSTRGDELRMFQKRHAAADHRIRLIRGETQVGIAANTNRGINAAIGDYVAFLDHDDELAPDALFYVVQALQDRRYGLIYSDEDRIEEEGIDDVVHHTPFYKPAFDPDLLRSMNYICHLVAFRRDILTALGGLREGFEGAQDHDLLLRASERLDRDAVRHIPRILYHWRVTSGSVSQTASRVSSICRNIESAVSEHLARLGAPNAIVEPHEDRFGIARGFATRVRWPLPSPAPSVSIILPTRDRLDLLRPCVDSLLNARDEYPGPFEIVIVDNDSRDPETLAYLTQCASRSDMRILPFQGAFNWSAINNVAAQETQADILIFLNNDTVVLAKDWCRELASHAWRPEVGAVGARLLYHDGTIQHAGVALGVEGVAGHEAVGELPDKGGYFGRTHILRGTSAVTGACLATRRTLFMELGGFDDMALKVAFNDIDYCLKITDAGYRVIYNPFAVLYHFESKSRGRDLTETQQDRHRTEAAWMRTRWGDLIDRDPFYNPHFERYARPFTRLRPPPRHA
jgi:glycosyltransferase involved in cell wall biosynthesis